MQVSDGRLGEQQPCCRFELASRHDLSAAIENAIVGLVAADQQLVPVGGQELGRHAGTFVVARARRGVDKDRPDLSVGLKLGKRPVGQHEERIARGDVLQAVAAKISIAV